MRCAETVNSGLARSAARRAETFSENGCWFARRPWCEAVDLGTDDAVKKFYSAFGQLQRAEQESIRVQNHFGAAAAQHLHPISRQLSLDHTVDNPDPVVSYT